MMRMLKNKLSARYQLTKLIITTYYVEPTTDILDDTFKKEDDVSNQGDVVIVGDLDVSRLVVKDETDMMMNGIKSHEDEVPIKDEVPVREDKATRLEDDTPMGQGS